jgi:predicted DCC family thiol-disulfide oxidoreductase YuxK
MHGKCSALTGFVNILSSRDRGRQVLFRMATMNISRRDLIRRDRERVAKIAHMQLLVDEARASGVSRESMDDIRARALKQAGMSS